MGPEVLFLDEKRERLRSMPNRSRSRVFDFYRISLDRISAHRSSPREELSSMIS